MERKYFKQIVEEEGKILIPKIQREYAEGRENNYIQLNVREPFLKKLIDFIYDSSLTEDMYINVVYGKRYNGAFVPLDGQQRLTTLFLLHWFFYPNDTDNINGDTDNINGDLVVNKKSVFTYETRETSELFCDELVENSSLDLVKEYIKTESFSGKNKYKENLIKENKKDFGSRKEPETKHYSDDPDSFYNFLLSKLEKWTYRYDPTVKSMLVVLNTIIDILIIKKSESKNQDDDLDLLSLDDQKVAYRNLDRIVFDYLDLDKLFNEENESTIKSKVEDDRGDELYIKMNSRGKPLSDFDVLKAYIESQISDDQYTYVRWIKLCEPVLAKYFWNYFISEQKEKKLQEKSKSSEEALRVLILHLISTQAEIKNNNGDSEYPNIDFIPNATSKISTLQRKMISGELTYDDKKQIDYKKLIDDLNNFFYLDDKGEPKSALDLIDERIKWDRKPVKETIISVLNANKPSVARQYIVLLYSLFSFVSRDGFSAKECAENKGKAERLNQWVSFIRNLFHPYNHDGFDNNKDATDALSYITYINQIKNISSLKYLPNPTGELLGIGDHLIEAQRFIFKKKVSGDKKWIDRIDNAEKIPYLNGQIAFLLNWAKTDSGNYDKDQFDNQFDTYYDFVLELFNFFEDKQIEENEKFSKYYQAFLLSGTDSLKSDDHYKFFRVMTTEGESAFDRDDSLKAYLRRDQQGKNLKLIFDSICNYKEPNLSFFDKIKKYVDERKRDILDDDWRYFFLQCDDWYGNNSSKKLRVSKSEEGIAYFWKNEKIDDKTEILADYANKKFGEEKVVVVDDRNFSVNNNKYTFEAQRNYHYKMTDDAGNTVCKSLIEAFQIIEEECA